MNPRPPPRGYSGNLHYAAAGAASPPPGQPRRARHAPAGSDPETVRNQLTDIEGVSVETVCAFPAALAGLVGSRAARYLHEDLPASVATPENAIRRGRPCERRNR